MDKTYTCSVCLTDHPHKGRGKLPTICPSCQQSYVAPVAPTTSTVGQGKSPTGKLPTLETISDDYDKLSPMIEEGDRQVEALDRKITLLSRLVMESILWDRRGMTKKEQFDAAIAAIRVIEGNKSVIWQSTGTSKDAPRTVEAFMEAKATIEKRLLKLIDTTKQGKTTKSDLINNIPGALVEGGEA